MRLCYLLENTYKLGQYWITKDGTVLYAFLSHKDYVKYNIKELSKKYSLKDETVKAIEKLDKNDEYQIYHIMFKEEWIRVYVNDELNIQFYSHINKKQLEAIDDSEITKSTAIVQSMTPAERRDPKILNGSRRARIAKGSGRQVSEVNNLVDRFGQAQKAMKMARSGAAIPGMPAMPGMPGMSGTGSTKPPIPNKKKSKSGNPAKRAAEEGR